MLTFFFLTHCYTILIFTYMMWSTVNIYRNKKNITAVTVFTSDILFGYFIQSPDIVLLDENVYLVGLSKNTRPDNVRH